MIKNEFFNEVGCNLFIDTINEHPSVITATSNIDATELIIKGEPHKTVSGKIIHQKVNPSNLWILKSEKVKAYSIDDDFIHNSILDLLHLIDGSKEIFIRLFKRFPENHLLCYGYFREGVNPYFYLDKTLLSKLAEYNLKIEFDFYVGLGS